MEWGLQWFHPEHSKLGTTVSFIGGQSNSILSHYMYNTHCMTPTLNRQGLWNSLGHHNNKDMQWYNRKLRFLFFLLFFFFFFFFCCCCCCCCCFCISDSGNTNYWFKTKVYYVDCTWNTFCSTCPVIDLLLPTLSKSQCSEHPSLSMNDEVLPKFFAMCTILYTYIPYYELIIMYMYVWLWMFVMIYVHKGPVHIWGENCPRPDPHITHMGYYLGPHKYKYT